MAQDTSSFIAASDKSLADSSLRKKINEAVGNYRQSFQYGVQQFSDLETARKRASFLRWKTIDNLDKYLIEFESNFIRSGGKVIWAVDAKQAADQVIEIVKRSGTSVVKSKSMTTEEIELNKALENKNISVIETDLGQFILQSAEEKSSHMVIPAIHKSKEEVVHLYHSKQWLNKNASVEEVVSFTRQFMQGEYAKASVGITGANFVIADSGAISITENEGNAVLCTAYPKVHVVLAGVDKLIPSINDLDLLLPLLSAYGTGQSLTAYNTIITGPKQSEEAQGPEEMYVILIDNGRSQVMEAEVQRQSLQCIHCGACQNACPVYKSIGGHAYESAYAGPVGAVISPLMYGMKEYKQLSESSTLCGLCNDVCPVKIDLKRSLLYNRKNSIEKQLYSKQEKWFYFLWKKAMLKRDIINWRGINSRKFILENIFLKSKGGKRILPKVAARSFNEQWRERMNIK